MNTEQIKATYMDHMGTDLTVVNAARASFDKESDWDYDVLPKMKRRLKPADANLIRFLATGYRAKEWDALLEQIMALSLSEDREAAKDCLAVVLKAYIRRAQHWAPFAHPHVQIRVTIPIFLARQFVKHQVGAVWSEESRRYVSDEPGVWFPDEWHSRPDDIKQGSGEPVEDQAVAFGYAVHAVGTSLGTYDAMLDRKVAPEEARLVLPLNHMTTIVWTGSLLFWSRVYNQRVDDHAQLAAQDLAKKIGSIVSPLYPVSWAALTE